ncbi:MAG: hypothetical protein KDK11_11830 [Maritimibacter sp.]|nr:hypothetical protein [Maritimibacter sp.]
MDIAAGIAAASETLKLVKSLKDLDHALDKAEMKSAMADLYSNLADVRIALSDAQVELREKEDEIAELKALLDEKKSMVEVDGFTYQATEDGKPTGLPFCPACLLNGKKIRPAYALADHYQCPVCEALYTGLKKY